MKLKLVEQGRLSEESYKKEFYHYIYKIVEEARARQSKMLGTGRATKHQFRARPAKKK